MARLGGVNFGAPGRPPPPPVRRGTSEFGQTDNAGTHEEQVQEGEDEENEEEVRARRAAIAARIAGQGGMRFGMFPGGQPRSMESPIEQEDQLTGEDLESVHEGTRTSDDVVKVEVPEESEIEGLDGKAAVPLFGSMLSESKIRSPMTEVPPPLPSGRPGQRRPTGQEPVPPQLPRSLTPTRVQGEYVLVDEPQEVHSPPPRPARPPPNRRSLPPPPLPTSATRAVSSSVESSDLTSSQWELPTIPTPLLG